VSALAEQAWPSVPERPRVFVPFGSTEQHGPHLPFATDTIVAEAVANGLVVDAFPDALVLPAMPVGASGEHQDFPGTSSLGTTALRFVIIELVRSIATWAGSITLVNGHGGNRDALSAAVPQLRSEGHTVAWVPCGVASGDAHAGRTETSLMLHLRPELVDLDRAVVGAVGDLAELLPRLTAEGTRAVSPSGILGDPTGASADEGALLLAEMVRGAIRRIEASWVDSRGLLIDPGSAS
jgi:creatinine amidohydrolase